MLTIENVNVVGWEEAIRGMRNPMNSWAKSDSHWANCEICTKPDSECPVVKRGGERPDCGDFYFIGENDHELMEKLAANGSVHAKYRRMITVYMDVTAPLYWWKEYDTYKVGTVANSCSTMHKIQEKEFTKDDFSVEHLINLFDIDSDARDMAPIVDAEVRGLNDACYVYGPNDILDLTINMLNKCRDLYQQTNDKNYWWQMIQLLPSSYNQKRTLMLNYEVLANIYRHRKDHKLDEWRHFCMMIEDLPLSHLITGKTAEKEKE